MTRSVLHPLKRVAADIARARQFTLRFYVLVFALLSYGSVPNTVVVESEVEAQLQELAAESTHCDLRTKLRGATLRRTVASAGGHVASSDLAARPASQLGPRVSLGLSLPLRC